LKHERLNAVNTSENPYEIAPQKGSGVTIDGGKAETRVDPYSWNVLRFQVTQKSE